MSTRKVTLDVIQVREPCHADWSVMTGDDRQRFCSSCNKHVHNLSAMSREDAENLLTAAEGRICVRYHRDREGRVATLTRRSLLARLAAGLGVVCTLGLTQGCEPTSPAGRLWDWVETRVLGRHTEVMGDIAMPPTLGTPVPVAGAVVMGESPTVPDAAVPEAGAIEMGQMKLADPEPAPERPLMGKLVAPPEDE